MTAALTPRQRELLGASARGLTVKEAAAEAGIAASTAKGHLAGAYRRLGADGRLGALLASGMLTARGECGCPMRCTRPAGHRGHHGGFRPLGPS